MPAKTLSVIIPTHNRREVLAKTLLAYGRQSALEEILEVLVVDDGSTGDTSRAVSEISRASPLRIRYLRQDRHGPATARNHGLREAAGNLVLFCDDDIVPRPTMVAEHLAWHRRRPDSALAAMGRVVWSPDVRATPFMKWYGSRGPLFDYAGLRRGAEVELYRSLFCNTSVKPAFFRQQGCFNEAFHTYGFEDIELAYRLRQKGWKLLYHPDAVGEHYKFVSFEDACERARQLAHTRTFFDTTEAGIYLKPLSAGQRNSIRYKIEKLLVRTVVPLLAPLKGLMDSPVPLPWPVYKAFYHHYKSR